MQQKGKYEDDRDTRVYTPGSCSHQHRISAIPSLTHVLQKPPCQIDIQLPQLFLAEHGGHRLIGARFYIEFPVNGQ